ncbi:MULTISPECIES: hypothetical protein [Frankia]|uniref:hypothetical protein n=1 Tax=Frankia TaxID=1854 RepID=UPI000AB85FB6|nr:MULTISPECIES: hypothetical protein [Frankia]
MPAAVLCPPAGRVRAAAVPGGSDHTRAVPAPGDGAPAARPPPLAAGRKTTAR